MRQCPTREGELRPLIAHRIAPCECMARQRAFYHKCGRCVFRGKSEDFTYELDEATQLNGSPPPPTAAREADALTLPRPAAAPARPIEALASET